MDIVEIDDGKDMWKAENSKKLLSFEHQYLA